MKLRSCVIPVAGILYVALDVAFGYTYDNPTYEAPIKRLLLATTLPPAVVREWQHPASDPPRQVFPNPARSPPYTNPNGGNGKLTRWNTQPPDYPSAQQERYSYDAARLLANAANIFGVNLMKTLIKQNENTVIAPLSLSTVLGMVYFSAAGNTKSQLARTLNYDKFGLNASQLLAGFKILSQSANSSSNQGMRLELANYIFAQKGLKITDRFRKIVHDNFRAGEEEVDFAGQPIPTRSRINNIVSEATKGLIRNAIDDIDPETKLMLVNAVYFKGLWKEPFDMKQSFDSTFANDGVNDVPVRMMYTHGYSLTKALPEIDAEAVQIPYEGEDAIMLIVLPNEKTGVNNVLERISLEKIIRDLPSYKNTRLTLMIPRFELKVEYKLKEQLTELGLTDMFIRGKADLPEIDHNRDLAVKEVIHQTKIKVDERGTEAAGVGTVLSATRIAGESFVVSHPFLFFVIHKPSGSVVFSGKVVRMENENLVAATKPENLVVATKPPQRVNIGQGFVFP